ncbi:ubiquinol oxidase subunit II [Buchnera aphidicola]|uniref:ubiquinol oxidase subunit II n=1 Tax=Buchnera aphidicola TaxID=9 RepID=UPI003CE4FE8E
MTCLNHIYIKLFRGLSLIVALFCLNGCSGTILSPHGSIAIKEYKLILISFIMMLFVVIPVIFMTIYFAIKYRSTNTNQIYRPNWSDSRKIEIIVWTIPIIIISFLAFLAWHNTHELEPKKSIVSIYNPIKIDVVALDWKWLFIYPDYHIATINEIMFPIDRPIIFHITSKSVMNSFFIPDLGSQIYAMPGMITKLNLIANYPGIHHGISSNYSGKGFSNMKFTAISVVKYSSFLEWIENIKKSPKTLNSIKDFNIVSIPNDNYSVEYFSNVQKQLFHQIVKQYCIKNCNI